MQLQRSSRAVCVEMLLKDEGYREFPYLDTRGIWTFGIGRTHISLDESIVLAKNDLISTYCEDIDGALKKLIQEKGYKEIPCEDVTGEMIFGIGRTFVTLQEALELLNNDINEAQKYLSLTNFYNMLNDARKIVLISMYINLGLPKLMKFDNMITALRKSDFNAASKQMLDSVWADQVKDRAKRLAMMMNTGAL